MQPASLRSATAADRGAILELNEGVVPHVNSIPLSVLEDLHRKCFSLTIAEVGGQLADFLLALGPQTDYDSLNFQWFRERYESFTYVDRIVVGASYRRLGIARDLYADLEQRSRGVDSLTCEVNLRPPNSGSVAFHRRIGFREVGQQDLEGSRRVSLMLKDISPAAEDALGLG